MKCADCECTPQECRNSKSPRDCPNCAKEECCCWRAIKAF